MNDIGPKYEGSIDRNRERARRRASNKLNGHESTGKLVLWQSLGLVVRHGISHSMQSTMDSENGSLWRKNQMG